MPDPNPLLIPGARPVREDFADDLSFNQAMVAFLQRSAFNAAKTIIVNTLRTQLLMTFQNRALTPQQALDAHGTDGKWLLILKAACDQFLTTIDPMFSPTSAPVQLTDEGTGHIVASPLE